MTQINAGLNDVEAWGGEIVQLPPGSYQFVVKAADIEEKADESGKPKSTLIVSAEVLSGAFAGKQVKSWFTLDFTKDTPRKRLKSLVLATGIPVDSAGGFDTTNLIGCKFNADVVVSSYEGKADPLTGVKPMKESAKVVNERPYGSLGVDTRQQESMPSAGKVMGGTGTGGSMPGLTKIG